MQLCLVGNSVQNQNEAVSYFDGEDIISCIIKVGDPLYGGDTMYYNGMGTSSNIEEKIRFHHCRL